MEAAKRGFWATRGDFLLDQEGHKKGDHYGQYEPPVPWSGDKGLSFKKYDESGRVYYTNYGKGGAPSSGGGSVLGNLMAGAAGAAEKVRGSLSGNPPT